MFFHSRTFSGGATDRVPLRMCRAWSIVLFVSIPAIAAPATQPSSGSPEAEVTATKGAPTTNPADEIRMWFADLAHSDAAVREEAMVNLMGLRRGDLPKLRKVVEESLPLAPSQTEVLRRIVIQVFLAGDTYEGNPQTGFLGIRMAPTSVSLRDFNPDAVQGRPLCGVVVESRMPGFCAGRMLRDGDVIIGITERPHVSLQTTPDFAAAIQDVAPGDTVHFEVLRQGQVRRIPITLDPRPNDADQGVIGMPDLLERRRKESDALWDGEFASLVKEGIS